MDLKTPLQEIKGVGEKTLKKLNKIGLYKIEDLFFHYPFRYENFGKPKKISELNEKEKAIFLARIEIIDSKRSFVKRKNFVKAIVKDDTGKLELTWFNNSYVKDYLENGSLYYFIGEPSFNSFKNLEIINPLFKKYNENEKIDNEVISPIYKTTSGLKQGILRNIIKNALKYDIAVEDYLPDYIKKDHDFYDLKKCVDMVHIPKSSNNMEKAKERLKFDELFFIQLINQKKRLEAEKRFAYKINFFEDETKKFIKSLGFDLTVKQKKVTWEILKDLEKEIPANRLLEGDVGSGKTVVFLISVLNVFLNRFQSAIMVPTSILAFQHYEKICKLFLEKNNFNFKINIALLTGKEAFLNNEKISKKELKEKLKNGSIDVIVGTHALLNEELEFKNLAFIVIDEQHRFGVDQRHTLSFTKSKNIKIFPHFLSVTATPIPRTLGLTFYGDLDISVLDEKPMNRKQIETGIIEKFNEVYKFILKELKEKKQIYIICPLIEETEDDNEFELEIKSAKRVFESISKLKDLKIYNIGLLHGKLKEKEKEDIQKKFSEGEINILVSTSVVEVGVDVPNANTIIIFGAEKFGLAQLYQLRGRVGRSDSQSFCFLQTASKTEKALNRLNCIIAAKNSFELAEMDMKERGVGEIYGLKQSGHFPDLKIASFFDTKIMEIAKEEAIKILKENKISQYKKLYEILKEKEEKIHKE